jgi:prepilin peptidase CpaA
MESIILCLWALVTASLLLVAAWWDVASREIPNRICLALALVGIAARLTIGPAELALSAAVAVGLFLALLIPHSFRMLGGGDVKLFAALAFGLPPIGVASLLLVTALAGGVLGMTHLAMRHLPRPRRVKANAWTLRRVYAAERWRALRHGPLPYAVAIALGGIWTVAKLIGA